MDSPTDFITLISRVRAGDAAAAAECVRLYEPEIRRAARVRLTDSRLRRLVDSMDICQSVFGRFFLHAATGSLDMERPEQLLAILVTMTRNRVTDLARAQTAQKRDHRRETELPWGLAGIPNDEAGPGSQVAANELFARVHELMTPEERAISEQRHAGHSWPEIAEQMQGSPESLRKKLERAIERIRESIGVG